MSVAVMAAHVTGNHMQASDVPSLIALVHTALDRLAQLPKPEVISLEGGKLYRTLKRHLTKLGLTPETHRDSWGLAHDYPMAAPSDVRARSESPSRWVSVAYAEKGETGRDLETGLSQT